MLGEIPVRSRLGLVVVAAATALTQHGDVERVHDLGAEGAEVGDGCSEEGVERRESLRVPRTLRGVARGAKDAESHTAQCIGLERAGVVGRHASVRLRRDGIGPGS